jgi:hypothetical protein
MFDKWLQVVIEREKERARRDKQSDARRKARRKAFLLASLCVRIKTTLLCPISLPG